VQVEDVRDRNPDRFGIGAHGRKIKKPGQPKLTGHCRYRDCAHLSLSDVLGSILGHDRFHLIFQSQFQFLQSSLFYLLL